MTHPLGTPACPGAMDDGRLQAQCRDCPDFLAAQRARNTDTDLLEWHPTPRDVALHGLPCPVRDSRALPVLTDEVGA